MPKQKLAAYDYVLPPERIAQQPPATRGNSKLLVVDRNSGKLTDRAYHDLVDYIPTDDVLVLNNVKVIPARLYGHAPGRTGKIEVLLLRKTELPNQWETLIGHKQRLGDNHEVIIGGVTVPIIQFFDDGRAILESPHLEKLSEGHGHMPLPKYIKRQDTLADRERYQTLVAKVPGAVAAPTASLNLTQDMLDTLTTKGVHIVYVTLYVGLGTFAPIRSEFIEDHQIHTEYAEIPTETATAITEAKNNGKEVWAIGTTVTRTLEGVWQQEGSITPWHGEISIYIHPPFAFKIVDHLVTNFHAPRTSVLLLAAAFAGKKHLFQAYQHALQHDYHFLSYGDSMLIL